MADEKNTHPIDEMDRIAKHVLKLDSLGFLESYKSDKHKHLIYNSKKCRVRLSWEGWDPVVGNTMHIRYGRLHASNEAATMVWQGDVCYCWHRVEYVLHFLDGRSPSDTAELGYSHTLIRSFRKADIMQQYKRQQPEWQAQIHLSVLSHYGQRLFDLFDLDRPDLWEQYQQFIKSVYDIAGRIPEIQPPLDKVC